MFLLSKIKSKQYKSALYLEPEMDGIANLTLQNTQSDLAKVRQALIKVPVLMLFHYNECLLNNATITPTLQIIRISYDFCF